VDPLLQSRLQALAISDPATQATPAFQSPQASGVAPVAAGPSTSDTLSLQGLGDSTPQVEDYQTYQPGYVPSPAPPAPQAATAAGTVSATNDPNPPAATVQPVDDATTNLAASTFHPEDQGKTPDSFQATMAGGSLVMAQVARYGSMDAALGRNLDIVVAVTPASPVAASQGASSQLSRDGRAQGNPYAVPGSEGLEDYA
jgi:hypothetical protein